MVAAVGRWRYCTVNAGRDGRAGTPTMTSFTEGGLNKRLKDLNSSQQSIQTLSLWLIHHRKYAHTVVKIWAKEIALGKIARTSLSPYACFKIVPVHIRICYISLALDMVVDTYEIIPVRLN